MKKFSWWDGQSQIPDANMSCLELIWEAIKALVPIIGLGLLALYLTGGQSCDIKMKDPPPKYRAPEPWERK
jgi:hypothetical protein